MSTNKVAKKSKSKKDVGEVQIQKSPAEFFAENQAIAGFDNLGKSLYTTIRELVENALDACEAIDALPDITVDITEYTQDEFNNQQTSSMLILSSSSSPLKKNMNNVSNDTELFEKRKKKKKSSIIPKTDNDEEVDANNETEKIEEDDKGKKKKGTSKVAQESYFLIKVKDNGCGMEHNAIPNLFGRVLSGSKYGVRQTRGKFGLGAKMALIWAKKSSGQPIRVTTAHRPTVTCVSPDEVSSCVLDIDIYKNEPRILEHEYFENDQNEPFIGTEVQVLIAGNWTTYKSRIVQYLQQLAIITPYAALQLQYKNQSDSKKDIFIQYDRRSEQMPPTPSTVKHHPASVNNIIIQQLIQFTKSKTLINFLCKELSAVSIPLGKRLIAELESANVGVNEEMSPKLLSDRQITRLVQLFRKVQLFKAPDGSCLSPLGEYNLNLGIHKVLEPELIATARDKAGAYEGHPFMVEAAVCLGSKDIKEGITVFRFANRIPLLFEGGADVSTRVAQTKIKWNNYKIDYKRDRVGVFVSIVSTKIPFKGTSKEYIGDDANEIHDSVKRALQSCCQQLRTHLTKRNALKDAQTRKSRLIKYVPDISRSLFGLLDGMRKRKIDIDLNDIVTSPITITQASRKRIKLNEEDAQKMIKQLDQGIITVAKIEECLRETIDKENPMAADSSAAANEAANMVARDKASVPLFIIPLYNLDDTQYDIRSELFTFRPIFPIPTKIITPTSFVQEE